ncbi:hypothetical protein M0802_009328 [Mischocyttarus mexicanus]|nr:hypothetical protein M0802_009328 [Mischocyttarus mexicanus]
MEDKNKESSKHNLDDNENDNKNDFQEKVSPESLDKEDAIENMNEIETMASSEINDKVDDTTVKIEFKKPTIMIGPKRGKRKIVPIPSSTTSTISTISTISTTSTTSTTSTAVAPLDKANTDQIKSLNENKKVKHSKTHKTSTLKYDEPSWSGKPKDEYKLEVLKSGVIIETIDLTKKSYYVVGRLPKCDISLAHPTISRFHAIFQYREIEDENNSKGLYIYDLESTHGTYWNGNRIPPNAYVRLLDSHIIKFGFSLRKFIVQALHESKEEESELSYTELREKRMIDLQEREKMKAAQESEMMEEEQLKKEEEENEGIDWGMGEDADEETDLTENPYAATNNEELYLNDPKKSLRGWFEREGYELQYHTEEKGFAQFLCWVDLPIENITGHAVQAKALVKGKKKECVIQCALEACKILDRYGLLRQATHESKRRKIRNWEDDDYYSSDEDNFLDRTGSIEKKRQKRMILAGKLETEKNTYDSLMEEHSAVVKKITDLVECMRKSQKFESESSKNEEDAEEDALDAFMSSLNATILTKADKRKMKVKLEGLRQEEAKLIKLLNPLRPTNLPPLSIHIVPLNESQKPNEMFDNDVKMNERKNAQTSNDETTVADPTNIPESKENNVNIVEEELKENSKEDSSETSDKKNSNNLESLDDTSQTPISTTETENDNLPKVKNVTVETKTLPKIVTSISPSCQSSTKTSKVTKIVKENYDKDVYNENYSTWVPPQNQSGDGKTSLNDKYGY